MVTSKQIILEANRLINTPFRHFGRSSSGIDCSGLVWIVHQRSGIDLPKSDGNSYDIMWSKRSKEERLLNSFQEFGRFELCDKPVIGGLILFRIFGKNYPINHCGILFGDNRFIHASCGIGNRINKTKTEEIYTTGYRKRIAGYMIQKDVCYGE